MRVFTTFIFLLVTLLISYPQQGRAQNPLPTQTQQNSQKRVRELNQLAEKNENSQPVLARTQAQDALVLARKINDVEGEALALKNIGTIYFLQSNYTQALEYFLSALKVFEALNNPRGIAETLNNVGVVYQKLGKYRQAKQYYNQVIKIDQQNNNQQGLASTYNNVGELYYQQNNYPLALQYYQKSFFIYQSIQDEQGLATTLKNIGVVEYAQSRFGTAKVNFLKASEIEKKINNQQGLASTLSNLANTYLKTSQSDSAKYYANLALDIAFEMDLKAVILEASSTLSDVYAIAGDYQKAFEHQLINAQIQKDIFNEESSKKITDLQTAYELEKKQIELEKKQIELEESNRRRQIQQIFMWVVLGASLIILVFAVFLYRANQQKKEANLLLKEQNKAIIIQNNEIKKQRNAIELQKNQIEKQRNEIAKKSQSIESSIQYAQRIQQAMLPREETIDKSLPLHFILYLPRDVVSGDFYWFARIEPKPIYAEETTAQGKEQVLKGFTSEKIVIAAVDCTGHGVPGAFMSMIGDSLMNQIILDKGILAPDQILDQMHQGIRTALKQSQTQNQDGMDIALCVIDPQEKTISYSGAKNSLLYMQNKKLYELKASILGLGGLTATKSEHIGYPKHVVSYKDTPTTIYLYSDGYQDQFGGPKNKKFMRRRFKELLFEIHQEPMHYQKDILLQTLNDWKKDERQMDDILVIGLRLS